MSRLIYLLGSETLPGSENNGHCLTLVFNNGHCLTLVFDNGHYLTLVFDNGHSL